MLEVAIGISFLVTALCAIAIGLHVRRSNRAYVDRMAADAGLCRRRGESNRKLVGRIADRMRTPSIVTGPWR